MAGPNKRNFIVHDIETSGTDPKAGHEIVQLGAVALRYQDYKIHELGEFSVLIKPQFPEKADPKAIEVIGKDLWERAIKDGLHPKIALRKYKEFCESLNWQNGYWTSPIRVGFNINAFDNGFIEYWMNEYKLINQKKDDKPWAWFSIDIAEGLFCLFGRDNLKNNKLDTYLELLNMKRTTTTHDALEDSRLTAGVFQRYIKFMTEHVRPLLKIKNEKQETVKTAT
jgi:DNA polymerase III epsilon subunit-like protein